MDVAATPRCTSLVVMTMAIFPTNDIGCLASIATLTPRTPVFEEDVAWPSSSSVYEMSYITWTETALKEPSPIFQLFLKLCQVLVLNER